MQVPCVKCKGKNPKQNCGRSYCPITAKAHARVASVKDIKQDFQSAAPNIFVGRVNYPNLDVGLLSPNDTTDASLHDAPRVWSGNNYDINQIINLRSALVNSKFVANVRATNRFVEIAQEIGMASKPVDIEVNLKDKPRFSLSTNPYTLPMGPNASLVKATVTSNPHIDRPVDKVVSDTDFKSVDAISQLYTKGYDENFLTKILSAGNLGVKMQRRMVPTRWSITAVDDILAKQIIEEVKYNDKVEHSAYFGSYLGNYFLVMFFPGVWSYELFETYMPESSFNVSKEYTFTTDYEPYSGRSTYAENCAGGYYASRLPALEKLKEIKKQGSVLVIRIISSEYYCPLGVFVVREATRKSMQSKPINFASRDLMLNYATLLVKRKFGYDISEILRSSILLKQMKEQKKLWEF